MKEFKVVHATLHRSGSTPTAALVSLCASKKSLADDDGVEVVTGDEGLDVHELGMVNGNVTISF